MNSIINIFFLLNFVFIFSDKPVHKYVLICTSKNCTPCVKTADEFFTKHNVKYSLINLYGNKAEKQFTDELIQNYCNTSKPKVKLINSKFNFGSLMYTSKDNGPFLIKYSKVDTVVFNALNIDEINN